jgi:branched-chain amino acid transport system ATP-binding protein
MARARARPVEDDFRAFSRPRAGTIEFDGQAIAGRSPDAIVALGLVQVPEGRRVFPELSVEENLRVRGLPDRQSTQGSEMLADVYAPVFRAWRKGEGSRGYTVRGEQQMLAFGRP